MSICEKVPAALAVMVLFGTGSAEAATIAQAKLTPTSTSVTINNAIITDIVDTSNSAASWVYYIQDATGGCAVIASPAHVQTNKNGPDGLPNTADDLRPGSVITITGTSVIFNGLFEVGEIPVAQTITYGGFAAAPTPTAVTTADLIDFSPTAPALVGKTVKLTSVKFVSTGTFAAATTYTVTDGINVADVRIPTSDVDLIGTPIPTGSVTMSGILSVFDSTAGSTTLATKDYQLLLLSSSSLVAVPEPVCMGMLAGCTMVLGRRRRS